MLTRVKSKNGIIFRKWANKILKDYLIKGYAVNEKRLERLEKTVKLIDIASRNLEELDHVGASDIIKVLQSYTKSLDLLDDYDHKTLTKQKEILVKRISLIKIVSILSKL